MHGIRTIKELNDAAKQHTPLPAPVPAAQPAQAK